MCSTEWWRDLFCCVWMVVFIGLFHQVWPLLLVPPPRPSSTCPRPPKPGTPENCPRIAPEVGSEGARGTAERAGQQRTLRPIQAVKDCPNPRCAYFAITDAAVHALVADGHHGQDGSIQNWQCQACGQHLSDRFGTFLYRLKKPEKVMVQALTSVSQGQGIRAMALSQGVDQDTVLAWWLRLGERAPVLWQEIAQGQVRVGAVQLDELPP